MKSLNSKFDTAERESLSQMVDQEKLESLTKVKWWKITEDINWYGRWHENIQHTCSRKTGRK